MSSPAKRTHLPRVGRGEAPKKVLGSSPLEVDAVSPYFLAMAEATVDDELQRSIVRDWIRRELTREAPWVLLISGAIEFAFLGQVGVVMGGATAVLLVLRYGRLPWRLRGQVARMFPVGAVVAVAAADTSFSISIDGQSRTIPYAEFSSAWRGKSVLLLGRPKGPTMVFLPLAAISDADAVAIESEVDDQRSGARWGLLIGAVLVLVVLLAVVVATGAFKH